MKNRFTWLLAAFTALIFFTVSSCKKDHTETGLPTINVSGSSSLMDFGSVTVGQTSSARTLSISGGNLNGDVTVTASAGYKVSLSTTDFTAGITIPAATANSGTTVYLQFSPTEVGVKAGTLKFESSDATTVEVQLTGIGGKLTNVPTFVSENLAFGTGLSQSAQHDYTFPMDVSQVNKIKMFVKLRCPAGGCGAWDVFAHIQVKDPSSGDWYELGRYITPYGVDNHAVGRGFEFDVTDFKSLLNGSVTLRAFTEVWTSNGWLLSVDFDYLEGTPPDYPYSAIAKVLQYNNHSLAGVIYGEPATAFDLTKTIDIPTNAESTSFRTIITGWGQATPYDAGGRSCAEWCFRTHTLKVNGANTFSHNMAAIDCAGNPVQPQAGNWDDDRAGWCPGKAVPVRVDQMASNMAGQSLSFEYSFQPWTNDLASGNHAYNAISTFVVVKSNTPIVKPTVID